MPWVRLDDVFPDHPKVEQVGAHAAWLHVCAICYCSRHLTDGFVSTARVSRLADVPKPLALAAALVEAGLWEEAPGGWMLHDYLEYQPSAVKVREQRAAAAERKQKSRNKSQGESQRDTTVTDAVTTGDAAAPPPHPTPSQVSRPSSSPPTSLDPTPEDDEHLIELANEEALRRLDQTRANGRTVTKVDKWLETTTADVLGDLRALRDRLAVEYPHLTEAQLRAALAGQWGAVQDLCTVCDMGWVVSGEVDDGLTRCRACAVPEGVVA